MEENIFQKIWSHRNHISHHFQKTTDRLLSKKPPKVVSILFFSVFLIGAIIFWIDYLILGFHFGFKRCPRRIGLSVNCTGGNSTACPAYRSPPLSCPFDEWRARACPDYFRWIYEDLRPWKATGITRQMLEESKKHAHFSLVILKGKVYFKKFKDSFQTRDVFTVWGILQLLVLYPGKVPDLELMFYGDDRPVIFKRNYQGENATSLPPLFHYCSSNDTWDIVFPDWTFWGWAETNISPWEHMSKAIRESNKKIKWKDREPYAFWKGNPYVSPVRGKLMKCNASNNHDWKAHLYKQDWNQEHSNGFRNSNLTEQCTHRYKIYIEGNAWSVSQKYIMACDSMTLLVRPVFYDFYIRGMRPLKHYWPVRVDNQCRDIKFAVEWGNKNTAKAEKIGREGSKFIRQSLKMENIYDYMLHLLTEYTKLLRFKPEVPKGAIEVCSQSMACSCEPKCKKFMLDSMVKYSSDKAPCKMAPPFEASTLEASMMKKERIFEKVERWEREHWERNNNNNNNGS